MNKEKIHWAMCQQKSDELLAEGLFTLLRQPNTGEIIDTKHGNYLISLNKDHLYIGESKNLSIRISHHLKKQQFENCTIRHIETNIGRKEIEEFGIVNIPTRLNKFQLNKRNLAPPAHKCTLWLNSQSQSNDLLNEGENIVLEQPRTPWPDAIPPTHAGVYLVFSANHGASDEKLIYIGETSNIAERFKTHSSYTRMSALRRHIGTEELGFTLKTRNGKKLYLPDDEDTTVTKFLLSCKIAFLPVNFGRFELEEYLIKKLKPALNRKSSVL